MELERDTFIPPKKKGFLEIEEIDFLLHLEVEVMEISACVASYDRRNSKILVFENGKYL